MTVLLSNLDFDTEALFYILLVNYVRIYLTYVLKQVPIEYNITSKQMKMVYVLSLLDITIFGVFLWCIYEILECQYYVYHCNHPCSDHDSTCTTGVTFDDMRQKLTHLHATKIIELTAACVTLIINNIIIDWCIVYVLFYEVLYELIGHYEKSKQKRLRSENLNTYLHYNRQQDHNYQNHMHIEHSLYTKYSTYTNYHEFAKYY